jgi:hypothetical protein
MKTLHTFIYGNKNKPLKVSKCKKKKEKGKKKKLFLLVLKKKQRFYTMLRLF